MKVSNDHDYPPKNSSKIGVTFNTLETIERNSDSIDKPTFLISKMNMKMDTCETQ